MRPPGLVLAALLLCAPAWAQTTADLDALEKQGEAAFTAGRTPEAVATFKKLAAGRHATSDLAGEARAQWRLSVSLRGTGQTAPAIAAARTALALADRAQADDLAAEALIAHFQLNALPPALASAKALLDEALRRATIAGKAKTLARAHEQLARWYSENGTLEDAIRETDLGLKEARAAADEAQIVGLLSIRSTFVSRGGYLGEALADALQASEIAKQVGPRAEVTALFVLAQSHSHLSNTDEAIRLWTEVIDRYRKLGPPIGVPIALDARCHVQYEAGRFEDTIADAKASIEGFVALGQRPLSPSYSRAGMANIRLGRDTEARRWLADAEARLAQAPDYEKVQTLHHLGIAYNMLGEAANAVRVYDLVLALGRQRHSLEDEWKAQLGLGRAALLTRELDQAIAHLSQAADLVERLRTTVPSQELRAAYLSRRVEAHEWLATAYMMQAASPSDRFIEAAFNTAERAHVRALSDLLAEARSVRKKSRTIAPPPQAMTRAAIAQRLAPGEAVLEFLVGEEHAYGWLLTRDDLTGFNLPDPKTLDQQVRLANALIAADDRDGLRELADDLTPSLLGPALARLKGIRRLLIVPDGPLERLSFAALPIPSDDPSYLAQHTVLASVGSGSLLGLLADAPVSEGSSVLAVAAQTGATALTETRGEVGDAIRLLDVDGHGRSITDATEAALKSSDLSSYRVVHVAAHAVVDEHSPRDSAVLLNAVGSEDGRLTAREIAALPLQADLVVLAACRTQLGRLMRGEGLISLARAFIESGARSVVATLWDVGDHDTRVLMRSFYAGIRGGLAPDEALRVAQLQAIRSGGSMAAPRMWAAFQVTGEGRQPVFAGGAPPIAESLVAMLAVAALVAMVVRH